MAKAVNEKYNNILRALCVKDILYKYTDEDHYLTVSEILGMLKLNYGITSIRQTIYDDIDMFVKSGYDIECVKGRKNKYHVLSREFDIAELRVLIDAVESLQSIPSCQAKNLIKKLADLGGPSADYLMETVDVDGRPRADNSKFNYIIDTIHHAIADKRQIAFKYFEYLSSTEKALKNNGKKYEVSPYRLVCCNDYYYLLGLSHDRMKVTAFRVDRISGIPTILDRTCIPEPKDLYINKYIRESFHMKSGEPASITLQFDSDVMDAMVDRFGQEMDITFIGKDICNAKVDIQVNNVFFAWIFGFEGKVQIKSPSNIRMAYVRMVSKEMARL